MAVAVRRRGGTPDDISERFWYWLHGLRIRSDVPLPLEPEQRAPGTYPDVVVRRRELEAQPEPVGVVTSWAPRDACGPACAAPGPNCRIHPPSTLVRRDGAEAWYWNRSLGAIHARPRDRIVDVFPPRRGRRTRARIDAGTGRHAVCTPEAGQARPARQRRRLRWRRGRRISRARARSKQRAANLQRRGAAFLAYDVLSLCLVDDVVSCSETTLPLRALYVLEPYDPANTGLADCSIQRLSRSESLVRLIQAMSARGFMLPNEDLELLPFYARLVMQAPLRGASLPL
jgi:hypothetical protein